MRIYIAGAYTASTSEQVEANVQRAIDAGIALLRLGHQIYLPHLTHYLELRNQEVGAGLGYEDYMRLDAEWLRQCHGLLFLGHSPGADRELAHAKQRGLVIFESLAEVPTNQSAAVTA